MDLLTSFQEKGIHGNSEMYWLDPKYICRPENLQKTLASDFLRGTISKFPLTIKEDKWQKGFKPKTPESLPKTFWYRLSPDNNDFIESSLYNYVKELLGECDVPVEKNGKDTFAALYYKMAPNTAIEIHKDWVRKTVFLLPLHNCEESYLNIFEEEDGPVVNRMRFEEGKSLLFDNSNIWHSGENNLDKERICFCISFFEHNYEFLKERLHDVCPSYS